MEKRTILAIALSVLVFIAFQWYQQRYMSPAGGPQTQTSQSRERRQPEGRPPAEQPVTEAEAPGPSGAVPSAEAAPEPSGAVRSAEDTRAEARTVVVEGDIYRAVIDNRGGFLASWELKDYRSAQEGVFEMVATPHNSGSSFPGSLIFPDPAVTALANNELYELSTEGAPGAGGVLKPPVTVILKLRRGDLAVEKRYTFLQGNYLLDIAATAEKGGKPLDGRFLLGQDIGPEQEHFSSSTALQVVYSSGADVEREGPPDDEKQVKKIGTDIRWVGLDMKYFAMIAIPSEPLPYFDIQKLPVKGIGLDGKQADRDLLRVTLPMSGSLKSQMYLGPKKQSNLDAVRSADITGVIDYGMFSILVLPLLSSLRWIHQFVHNYGFAIIILTFLLSLLLFPFRLKQMVSMKKMQAVQPKVKAIQEKYRRYKKTDPKRAEMNQEIMALYKQHNVNPLGGCLPLVLQFPLLLAFYNLLAYSIELRQAPFVWWMHDLSAKDPYYVLPVVMGITMFISQKMTPMTPGTDPTQAKIMMVMPVVFTLMFFNVSSGLNLYFLCSNIFQVGFQKIAERWMGDGKSGNAKSSKSSKSAKS